MERKIKNVVLKLLPKIPGYIRKTKRARTREEAYLVVRKVCFEVRRTAGVNIIYDGEWNIPSGACLFTPNHQGSFDPIAMICNDSEVVRFVLKKELMKYSVVRLIVEKCGFWAMNRGNIRQSVRVISDVTEALKNGDKCLIFPEGTRSKDGNNLLDFKGGSFKAATKAKVPIVPVCIKDSYRVFTSDEKHFLVKVFFLEPLNYEDYKDMKTNDIAEYVKNKIQEKMEEPD